jgi:hypothetical protein
MKVGNAMYEDTGLEDVYRLDEHTMKLCITSAMS